MDVNVKEQLLFVGSLGTHNLYSMGKWKRCQKLLYVKLEFHKPKLTLWSLSSRHLCSFLPPGSCRVTQISPNFMFGSDYVAGQKCSQAKDSCLPLGGQEIPRLPYRPASSLEVFVLGVVFLRDLRSRCARPP
jgi:hypothetical protein